MKRSLVWVLALGVLAATHAEAQQCRRGRICYVRAHRHKREPVQFGVRGGYDFGAEAGSAGAQLRIPLVRPLGFVPSGDVYFDGERSEWQLNADVVVAPAELGGLYAGVGAAFAERPADGGRIVEVFANRYAGSGEREVRAGYNLFLGLLGRALLDTRLRPFAEARWTVLERYRPFRLVAGVDVPVR